jgi:ATP-dependent RNA helicase RhlE
MTSHKKNTPSVDGASTFSELGIGEKMLAVLSKHGFVTPTPIQHKVIPVGLSGKDVIGIAQTGTGKTLGFGIPMVERIIREDGLGLIMLPTRELALQVSETIDKIGRPFGVHPVVLIGGDSMGRQCRELRMRPQVVVATPGRLIDHLKQGTVKLDHVSVLVLDEADHMFDIGFAPQIREILKKVPKERQTMLFSATMPDEIAKLAAEHLQLPLRIDVAPAGTTAERVEQEIIIVSRGAKVSLLTKLVAETEGPVLVFTRTKHGAKNLSQSLRDSGFTAAEIHSNRSLGQRREALDGFKKHKYRILVATDIAARGIDVKDIGLVVNFDLPEQSDDYVHRIGRTGRAGKAGKAISFATPDQHRDIADIERLIKKSIPKSSHDGASIDPHARPERRGRGGFRGGRGGGFSRGPRAPFNPHGPSAQGPRRYNSGRPAYTGSRGSSSRPAGPRRETRDSSQTKQFSPTVRRVFRKL